MPSRKRQETELPSHPFRFTTFTTASSLNLKNFYTGYLKNDNQTLSTRLIQDNLKKAAAAKSQREAAAAAAKAGTPDDTASLAPEDEDDAAEQAAGSKTIVLHLGSSNMRVGLASAYQPETVPMVIARRAPGSSFVSRPLAEADRNFGPGMFGQRFEESWAKLEATMKQRMRDAKRRQVPQAAEMSANFNNRSKPEDVNEHNDSGKVEWTDVSTEPPIITGVAALRIPPDSQPPYNLYRPIQYGLLNEDIYSHLPQALGDIRIILEAAFINELNIARSSFSEYGLAFIIPDLYDRTLVEKLLEMFMREFNFTEIAVLQESTCSVYGAGMTSACVIDVGSQTTTISCVEDGAVIADSRASLAFGGDDMTLLFTKLLLRAQFPYREFDLSRTFDMAFAEDLKLRFCTANEADAAIQLYSAFQRQPGRRTTHKYEFKVYDDQILTPMSVYEPSIYELEGKQGGRRKFLQPAVDIFEGTPVEPESVLQDRLVYGRSDKEANALLVPPGGPRVGVQPAQKPANGDAANAATAATDSTPMEVDGVDASPAPASAAQLAESVSLPEPVATDETIAQLKEQAPPRPVVFPLDQAVVASIECACENIPVPQAEERLKALTSTVIITGAGYNFPFAGHYLHERLHTLRPGWAHLAIIPAPRELDPAVLAWKGMSILARCRVYAEFAITREEYDRIGLRSMQAKSNGYFWLG
ncbi:Actin-like protein arp8 [Savitreella phatthalungensis]